MIRAKTPEIHEIERPLRGWEALEEKLKARGLSAGEIDQARRSFHAGMEALAGMFKMSFPAGKEE